MFSNESPIEEEDSKKNKKNKKKKSHKADDDIFSSATGDDDMFNETKPNSNKIKVKIGNASSKTKAKRLSLTPEKKPADEEDEFGDFAPAPVDITVQSMKLVAEPSCANDCTMSRV